MTKDTATKDEIETPEAQAGELVAPGAAPAGELMVRAGEGLSTVAAMIEALPNAEDDPTETMIQFVLNSESWQDWAKLWESRGLRSLDGRAIRVHAIRGARSNFKESRIGHFLVLDITDLGSGERTVATTGSELTMAQLIVAHNRGWFPMDFEVIQKTTETAKGGRPMHLRALGRVVQVGDTEQRVQGQP